MAKARSKTLHVRITDEWTADETATVYSVLFKTKEGERLIRVQNLINKGKHEALLLGMSLHALQNWLSNDPREHQPEIYNEIYDKGTREWKRLLSHVELMELIDGAD